MPWRMHGRRHARTGRWYPDRSSSSEREVPMSLEHNKQLARRLIEAHVRHDAAQVSEILSPRLVWHTGGQAMSRDDYLAGLEMGARAFSDQTIDIVSMIAEDDRVAV